MGKHWKKAAKWTAVTFVSILLAYGVGRLLDSWLRDDDLQPSDLRAHAVLTSSLLRNVVLQDEAMALDLRIGNTSGGAWSDVHVNVYLALYLNPKETDLRIPERFFPIYKGRLRDGVLPDGESTKIDLAGETGRILKLFSKSISDGGHLFPVIPDYVIRPTYLLNDDSIKKHGLGGLQNIYLSQNHVSGDSLREAFSDVCKGDERFQIPFSEGKASAGLSYFVELRGLSRGRPFTKTLHAHLGWGWTENQAGLTLPGYQFSTTIGDLCQDVIEDEDGLRRQVRAENTYQVAFDPSRDDVNAAVHRMGVEFSVDVATFVVAFKDGREAHYTKILPFGVSPFRGLRPVGYGQSNSLNFTVGGEVKEIRKVMQNMP